MALIQATFVKYTASYTRCVTQAELQKYVLQEPTSVLVPTYHQFLLSFSTGPFLSTLVLGHGRKNTGILVSRPFNLNTVMTLLQPVFRMSVYII